MGYSRTEYPYTGGAQDFVFNPALGVLDPDDVQVYVIGEVDGLGDQTYRAYTRPVAGTIRVTAALPNPCTVVIQRTVPKDTLEIDLEQTGSVTRVSLVRAFKQAMMNIHELLDGRLDGFTGPILDSVLGIRDQAQTARTGAETARDAAEASATLAATFNPALYTRKASAEAVTAGWSFSSTLKMLGTGILHWGASDEANVQYSTGLNVQSDTIRLRNKLGTAQMLLATAGAAVSLFFNNAQKLITTNTGVTVTGAVSADTVAGTWIASTAEAIAGALNTKVLTPLGLKAAQDARSIVTRVNIGSAVATVDIVLPAGYTRHVLHLDAFRPANDDVWLLMRVSTDGGTSFLTDALYNSQRVGAITAAAPGTSYEGAQAAFNIAASVGGAVAAERGVSARLEARALALQFIMQGPAYCLNRDGALVGNSVTLFRDTPSVNALRLFYATGNIASGEYRIESFKE